MTTLKDAKKLLADIGMTITCRDGEYRVNFREGREATASYHTDLDDAIGTAQDMAAWIVGVGGTRQQPEQ